MSGKSDLPAAGESSTLAKVEPEPKQKFKSTIKVARSAIKTMTTRGTSGYVYVEISSTQLPRIDLEVENDG